MSKKTGLIIIIFALVVGVWVYLSIKNNEANLNEFNPQTPGGNALAPISSVPPQFSDWINNLNKVSESVDTKESLPTPIAGQEENQNKENIVAGGGTVIVSNEAIFARLWPEWYIKTLNKWQDAMLKDGFLKESKRSNFKTNEEIYAFLSGSIDYWVKTGVINVLERDSAVRGIEKLKQLKEIEAKEFVKNKGGSSAACKNQFGLATIIKSPKIQPKIKESSLLKFALPAFAQMTTILGIDCWKVGAGVGPICGASLWAPCCKCYCGASSCGCLNEVCACCNAIWDSVTKICGCDIVGGC